MNMEDKEFMEKYILNNPFEFKQGIISHCREMDKIDVYNWVAEDELKIDKLQQENKILKENAENNDKVVDKVNWENQLLKKENKQLKERIGYLERSNNRREDTILEQRQNLSDLEDNWNTLKDYINKYIKYDKNGRKISRYLNAVVIMSKINKLEKGSDSNE